MAQPNFDDDAIYFSQEEEVLAKTIKLDVTEQPPPPMVELKPLPPGLKYVFLHGNRQTPVFISDKLTEEETKRLVVVLE
jgi:hypothetical protein